MAAHEYHFTTRWRFWSTAQEVLDILEDPTDLVRWWPSVYLDVQVIQEGDEERIGELVALYTRGWLPYTLRWQLRITEIIPQSKIAFDVWGDFTGRGVWLFEEEDEWVHVTYEWHVRVNKPLLRFFSFLLKPIFSANHRWAMKEGEKSLRRELTRRQAIKASRSTE
jgi:hypothetical protein